MHLNKTIDWPSIAHRVYAWVESVKWHNKTPLENLALIASEIGEAGLAFFTNPQSLEYGEELADISMRVSDLALEHNINLTKAIEIGRDTIVWRSHTQMEDFMEVMAELSVLVNLARLNELKTMKGCEYVGRILARLEAIATSANVNLEAVMHAKMAVNEQRGTRNRPL